MEPEPAASPAWSPAQRIGFRFVFVYLILYNLPFPAGLWWDGDRLSRGYEALWKAVVPWVGREVLRLPEPITIFPAGSGDTTFNYVQVLCFAVLALIATVVWTALDGRRPSYERLHRWLRVYLRLALGVTMVSYGAVKVIKSQFRSPWLARPVQPYGDSSPMGLLWTFMGYSYPYNIFTGAGETISGALLFLRRTTTLGAFVGCGVLGHIVVLNFAYDVPVKLFSLHLLAMAVFLLAPDVRRLVDFFLRGRAVSLRPREDLFASLGRNRAALYLRSAFFVTIAGLCFLQAWQGAHEWGEYATRSPLHGLYEVVEFSLDGEARPPLTSDRGRWRRLVIERPQFVSVVLMDDTVSRFGWSADLEKRTLTLKGEEGKPPQAVLHYEQAGNELVLEGELRGSPIRTRLRKKDPGTFLLLNRGFHWVNEYPFNR
jgi:hypothetical protein